MIYTELKNTIYSVYANNAIIDKSMDWFYLEDDKLKSVLKEIINNGGDIH